MGEKFSRCGFFCPSRAGVVNNLVCPRRVLFSYNNPSNKDIMSSADISWITPHSLRRTWTFRQEKKLWKYLALHGPDFSTIKEVDAKGKKVLVKKSEMALYTKAQSLKTQYYLKDPSGTRLPPKCRRINDTCAPKQSEACCVIKNPNRLVASTVSHTTQRAPKRLNNTQSKSQKPHCATSQPVLSSLEYGEIDTQPKLDKAMGCSILLKDLAVIPHRLRMDKPYVRWTFTVSKEDVQRLAKDVKISDRFVANESHLR